MWDRAWGKDQFIVPEHVVGFQFKAGNIFSKVNNVRRNAVCFYNVLYK